MSRSATDGRSMGSSARGSLEPSAQLRSWACALDRPRASGWCDVAVALALTVGYTALLLATVDGLGYARDEGFYFHAARSYQRWFELLWQEPGRAVEQADAAWHVNREHPALLKSLFALSHLFGFERWRLFDMEGTSFRFPAMVLSSLGVGLVYLWGARACGRLVGMVAAASLAAMPRFFFHAHLACFDAPIVTMWTLCAYAYWRSLARGGWLWPLVAGLSFGLALNTKHNSWFLPIVCGLHALLVVTLPPIWANAHRLGGGLKALRRVLLGRAAAALLAMGVLGPTLLYASWPWLWRDPIARFGAYARFHLDHVYYNMEFLGVNYWTPPMPRSYAFAMTAATVPAVTLALFGLGALYAFRAGLRARWRALRDAHRASGAAAQQARSSFGSPADVARVDSRHERGAAHRPMLEPATALFWALAMAVQYGAWLSSQTPIFGGTKHWMTAYPFLALFAGLGLSVAVRAARRLASRPGRASAGWLERGAAGVGLEAAFFASALAAPVAETAGGHPWGLSSYTPLVGGAAGAATLGLNRGFWGYTTGAVTGYLNETAPRRGTVYVHDTAGPAWDMLVRDGRLRRDLRGVWTIAGADFGLYHHEKHMSGQEYQNWVAFGTARPAHIAGLDGVPVIWVYRRPGLPPPPPIPRERR